MPTGLKQSTNPACMHITQKTRKFTRQLSEYLPRLKLTIETNSHSVKYKLIKVSKASLNNRLKITEVSSCKIFNTEGMAEKSTVPPVDLFHHFEEQLVRQSLGNLVDVSADYVEALFLIDGVRVGQTQLLVQIPDYFFSLGVGTSVVLLHDLPLSGGRPLERHHRQPGAFALADVVAPLARHGRVAEAVQEVVLGNRKKKFNNDSHSNNFTHFEVMLCSILSKNKVPRTGEVGCLQGSQNKQLAFI